MPALIIHVVFRFDTGGLENGVVNLINELPRQRFRHVVVALTEVTAFARRINRNDVSCIALGKGPGHGFRLYPTLFRLFRELRPAIVHTRNLAALEAQLPAWAAGVPVRIHSEHGRDVEDPRGTVARYQWIRRAYRPFVDHYVALSADLARYLRDRVRVPESEVTQIINGVDTDRFHPPTAGRERVEGFPFHGDGHFVLGTVGRMRSVKAQPLLARAFVRALELQPLVRDRLRLVMIGDGPLRAEVESILAQSGMSDRAWLSGDREDVPALMRVMHAFVLPSLAEGISNTVLEAMASGLPVLATRVGGTAELVVNGQTGLLVPAGDIDAMARGILALVQNPEQTSAMGIAGRKRAETEFSLKSMVGTYAELYSRLLDRRGMASAMTA
jgi:sugar transferase (PEP-CTERM/EpsH1 system associated)